jgi:hypothetical protein
LLFGKIKKYGNRYRNCNRVLKYKEMSEAVIEVKRYWSNENQSSGTCAVLIDRFPMFTALSLERGWVLNERNVSCIPKGTYKLVLEYSPRFKTDLWEIKGVPNRSECKFHSANYWFQLNGCIALGESYGDINKDGYKDVTNSKKIMKSFHDVLKDFTEATLIVS